MTVELLYLDSSAIVKLVAREPETTSLVDRLKDGPDVVSSALARVEVLRAVRRARSSAAEVRRARTVLESIALLRIDDIVLDRATVIGAPALRSLDAIHLASALSLGDALTGIVTYDRQLATEAEKVGIEVLMPSSRSS